MLCQNIICFSVLLINNDDDGEEKRERHTSTLAWSTLIVVLKNPTLVASNNSETLRNRDGKGRVTDRQVIIVLPKMKRR